MFYFFINLIMYIILIVFMYQYFNRRKIIILDFLLLLFNANIYILLLFKNFNFIYGIIVSICTILIKKLYFSCINLFNRKNDEVLIIKEGIIDFKNLIKCGYTYDRLIKYIKRRKIRLDEIEYCFYINGMISIIRNKGSFKYPVSVIIDGNILNDNLSLIKKDNDWLEDELNKSNLKLSLVDYAYFKKDKLYFVTV